MIIEGAFYKLPELLLGDLSSKRQYEGTLTSHLAMAILLELSARNIELPMHRVHIEMPYPELPGGRSPGRADLFVDLSGVYARSVPGWYAQYGMKPSTWMEAKLFARIRERAGTETKTSNAGLMGADLLRLCLFVQEERSTFRENARYFLVVFDDQPEQYLAFTRRSPDHPSRDWIGNLLSSGDRRVKIDLAEEPDSFVRVFFPKPQTQHRDLRMELRVITREFSPADTVSEFLYWGYLVRIVDFNITHAGNTLTYTDSDTDPWTEERIALQQGFIRSLGRVGAA